MLGPWCWFARGTHAGTRRSYEHVCLWLALSWTQHLRGFSKSGHRQDSANRTHKASHESRLAYAGINSIRTEFADGSTIRKAPKEQPLTEAWLDTSLAACDKESNTVPPDWTCPVAVTTTEYEWP